MSENKEVITDFKYFLIELSGFLNFRQNPSIITRKYLAKIKKLIDFLEGLE